MNVLLARVSSLQECSNALIYVLILVEGGIHAYGCGGVPLPPLYQGYCTADIPPLVLSIPDAGYDWGICSGHCFNKSGVSCRHYHLLHYLHHLGIPVDLRQSGLVPFHCHFDGYDFRHSVLDFGEVDHLSAD